MERGIMKKGILVVISGFSGAGKGTVLNELLKRYGSTYALSISATTRDMRAGEAEGVNYFYKTQEAFEKMIEENMLLEYAPYNNNYYGTPIDQLEEKLARGNVILDIEPNGAFNVRKVRPDAVLIFIAPPSMEELLRRLVGRGDTPPDQVKVRQERVQWEMDQSVHYDYVVVNDQVETCVEEILKIIAEKAD